MSEKPRADLHTLDEFHEHLLSTSFDTSFQNSDGAVWNPSSSQLDRGFGFDDNLFADDLDMGGGIGDELARELGDGWSLEIKDA